MEQWKHKMNLLALIKSLFNNARRHESIPLIPSHLRVPYHMRKPHSGCEVYMLKTDAMLKESNDRKMRYDALIEDTREFVEAADRPERRVEIV